MLFIAFLFVYMPNVIINYNKARGYFMPLSINKTWVDNKIVLHRNKPAKFRNLIVIILVPDDDISLSVGDRESIYPCSPLALTSKK